MGSGAPLRPPPRPRPLQLGHLGRRRPPLALGVGRGAPARRLFCAPLSCHQRASFARRNFLSISPALLPAGKPRGINAARKLRTVRRTQRWAQKRYKKAHLGTQFKCNPFGGSSHCKGIVLEKIGIEAKQPNSAIRKCVRAQLIKNGKKIAAFVPRDGCLNFVDENDEVLIAGFGRKGHAVGDIPGVRFKVVKVSGVALLALYREKKEKPRS